MPLPITLIRQPIRQWVMSAPFWYAVLACCLVVLGFLSLNPWFRPASREGIFSPDKLEHALAYGGVAIIAFLCLTTARNGSMASQASMHNTARAWITALSFSALVGIAMEFAQSLLTVNRTGSVADAIANAIGAALGFVAYQAVKTIRAKIAHR